MTQISDNDIKEMLISFSGGLSFKDFEECIRDCLGDDFKDTGKRYEGEAGRKDPNFDPNRDEEKEGDIANVQEAVSKLAEVLNQLSEYLDSIDDPVTKAVADIINAAIADGEEDDMEKFLQDFLPLLESIAKDPNNENNRKLRANLTTEYGQENSELETRHFFYRKIDAKNKDGVVKTRTIIKHIISNRKYIKIFGKSLTAAIKKINNSSFGELVKKSTEKVRSIAKKKGIYIIGRKNRKFLGIKFLKSGSYSKKKNKKPNCKEYSYDQIKKMKNTKYKIDWKKSKLPELIDKMNIKDVKQKFGYFQFGFELLPQRGCGSKFGYTFPKGATRGYGSTLLYSKI